MLASVARRIGRGFPNHLLALERYKEGAVQTGRGNARRRNLVRHETSPTGTFLRPRPRPADLSTPSRTITSVGVHRRHLQRLHGFGIVDGIRSRPAVTRRHAHGRTGNRHRRARPRDSTSRGGDDAASLTARRRRRVWLSSTPREASIGARIRKDEWPEWSRIEEGCRVVLANDSCEHGVTIARLIRDQNNWRADDTFVAARPR